MWLEWVHEKFCPHCPCSFNCAPSILEQRHKISNCTPSGESTILQESTRYVCDWVGGPGDVPLQALGDDVREDGEEERLGVPTLAQDDPGPSAANLPRTGQGVCETETI